MHFLYDGTYDGLLTCVYHHYYDKKVTGIYEEKTYKYSIIDPYKVISTNVEKAKRVYNGISNKISVKTLNSMYHAFLANDYNKDTYILKYLELGFRVGHELDSYHTHPKVLPILQLSQKVKKEKHLFLGILRFSEVGKGLYAVLEPDHNIITLLADHFADRLKNENFIIHDKKRSLAIIYNTREWIVSDFQFNKDAPITTREKEFQELWKGYFKHIGISSRKNSKLQRQFVPMRYRKNTVEFEEKNNKHR